MNRLVAFVGKVAGVAFAVFGIGVLWMTYGFSTLMSPAKHDNEYWSTLLGNLFSPNKGGLWGVLLGSLLLVGGVALIQSSFRFRAARE